jgi:hypothetical protein
LFVSTFHSNRCDPASRWQHCPARDPKNKEKRTVPNSKDMRELRELLHSEPVLTQRGFRFALEADTELSVHRGSHLRGVWRCAHGRFEWTPAGYSDPTHSVSGIEAAVRYTLVALATGN